MACRPTVGASLFAHWPVDPHALRGVLPAGVEPDVREGSAWLAIVAFVMVGTRATGPPWWPVLAPIPELNVRTYVRVHGIPAVWFLSLDASSTFGDGRTPALRHAVPRFRHAGDRDRRRMLYKSVRPGAAFEATYAPAGPPANAEEGSLEHFLVERYRLFPERRGRLITAVVAHEPWPLQPARARIAVNEMAPPGLRFRGEPIVHFCRSVSAMISAPSVAGSVMGDEAGRGVRRSVRRVRARRRVRPEAAPSCRPTRADALGPSTRPGTGPLEDRHRLPPDGPRPRIAHLQADRRRANRALARQRRRRVRRRAPRNGRRRPPRRLPIRELEAAVVQLAAAAHPPASAPVASEPW